MSFKAHILLVEDHAELCQLVDQNLRFEGFSVETAGDGEAALRLQQARAADLIVLDLMLPRLNGYEVLRQLRERGDRVPVLMLTARGEEADRVRGLALGADDYLVKPFSMLEFIARIQAILRRTLPMSTRTFLSGPFRVDPRAMTVSKDAVELPLTAKEFRIFEALLSGAGFTCSRKELIQRAWEPDCWPTPRTVDSHVAHLRKKLGDSDVKGWLVTVGGEGYRWTLPVHSEASSPQAARP